MTLPDLEQKLAQYPASPLFARLAKEYLITGRVEEAKQLCISGLQSYPSYATAHLVLAQCYHAEKNATKALEYLQEARTSLPDSLYMQTLYDEWRTQTTDQPVAQPFAPVTEEAASPPDSQAPTDEILTTSSDKTLEELPLEVQSTESILPQFAEEVRTQSIITEVFEEPVVTAPEETLLETQPAHALPPSVFDELTSAENLETPLLPDAGETVTNEPVTAGIIETPPPPVVVATVLPAQEETADEASPLPIDEGGRIVTKTLAEIYASQGAYPEAILTYQLLKTLRPAQSAEYDQRIKELQPKLQERTSI